MQEQKKRVRQRRPRQPIFIQERPDLGQNGWLVNLGDGHYMTLAVVIKVAKETGGEHLKMIKRMLDRAYLLGEMIPFDIAKIK